MRVGLGAAVAFELAPNTAAYLAAEVGLRWTYASLSAEGRYALPVTDKEGGFETSVAAGALVGCGHYGIGVACGVFAAGSRHAATLDGASSTSGLYLGAGGRLGIEIPFAQRFAIRIAGELLGTVKPWTVRINGMPRWTTPAGAGGLGGGLLAHF